jgi:selenocysteine lyase/cysteine desulfurase
MLGFKPPVADGDAFKRDLYERHRIEVPVVETKDGWTLRVSIQGYNDDADVDALVAALA